MCFHQAVESRPYDNVVCCDINPGTLNLQYLGLSQVVNRFKIHKLYLKTLLFHLQSGNRGTEIGIQ